MATKINIGDRELEIKAPKGRKGRKATNYLLKMLGSGEANVSDIVSLLEDPTFESEHLPVLLGTSTDFLEEEGTTTEIINAITAVITEMFEGFATPEVDAAVKN